MLASHLRTQNVGGSRCVSQAVRATVEELEFRRLLSAAGDLIGLAALRSDPTFSGIDGRGITVAVIDTGLDQSHPLLSGGYITGFDFLRNDSVPDDEQGHGTHVSGIVGARDPNIGVAPGVNLIGLKVGGANGTNSIDLRAVEAALQWVYDHQAQYNIRAVNMSLGGGFFTSPGQASGDILFDDVQRLEQAGVTVVSAAGNSYDQFQQPGSSSPGIFSTLDVGAVWEENEGGPIPRGAVQFRDNTTGADRITFFSFRPNTGNVIFAPGALILSTFPGGTYQEEGGTSQASPMVAGTAALMQQAAFQFGGRYLTPDEVRTIMQQNADTINDGDDEDTTVATTGLNFPRLNAYRAVQGVRALFGNPDPGQPQQPPPQQGNDTIAGAFAGPALDGSAVASVQGVLGTDGSLNIGGADVDIISFTTTVAGRVTMATYPTGGSIDTMLRVFDSAGNELAFNDDKSATDRASSLSVDLPVGTFYAGVSGFSNRSYDPNQAGSGVAGATGGYEIQFRLDSPDPNGLISGAFALNVTQEPKLVGGSIGYDNASFDANGNFLSGTITGPGDVDLFQLDIPDSGTLFVQTDTADFTTGFCDTFLRVFRLEGDGTITDLASNDDAQAPGDTTGHFTDSYVAVTVLRGEAVYVGVSDQANRPYDPGSLGGRNASGTGGFYDMVISFANNDLNGTIPTAASATLPYGPALGSIWSDGTSANVVGDRDVDFFHFRPASTGVIDVAVDSDGRQDLGTPMDSVLTLFDSAGNELMTNDDFDGADPRLQFLAQADTDYFVAVSGYGNQNFNPFVLASGTSGAVGDYVIAATFSPASAAQGLTDNSVQNATPTAIALGQTLGANVGADGAFYVGQNDVDLYRFVAPATQIITIRTGQTAGGDFTGANTFLRLFDANGNQLAANDNGIDGTTDSLLRTGVAAGQTYYIGINGVGPGAGNYDPRTGAGASNGSTGDYQLSVTAFNGFIVSGAERGAGPAVKAFDATTGVQDMSFFAYDGTFGGGVRVASADINGDGLPDVITAPGPGGQPNVRVFNGFTAQPIGGPLGSFLAYDANFRGGVLIATGDIDGDGRQDIITGVDAGVGPHVKVFSGTTGNEIRSFFAYDPQFWGGVRVAAGDVNGDGRDDIIVGSGSAGPHVKVFDGPTGNEIASFFAYDLGFLHGIYVAAGDVNGDGRAEVITGTGVGPTHVKAFAITNRNNPPTVASFFAYDGFLGGVRVGASDVTGDGVAEILTGTGPGSAHVKAFQAGNAQPVESFFAFPGFVGGIYVGG